MLLTLRAWNNVFAQGDGHTRIPGPANLTIGYVAYEAKT